MTRFNYICTSKSGTVLEGTVAFFPLKNLTLYERDQLLNKVMHEVAVIVHCAGMPWDPFNIELIVRAQIGPKP